MRKIVVFIISVVLVSACQSAKTVESDPSKQKRFDLKGKVISVDLPNKKASIEHEEVPGYMDAMTMDFVFKEDFVLRELTAGAEVKAELVVDNSQDPSYWLENVVVTSAPKPGQSPPPVKEGVAVTGKQIIDFSLTNQDGEKISPKDFAGKNWALTFIYSECPLPNFCIAMSRNFSDAANKIVEDDKLKESARLLTISFDPKRDTPEKLKSYGLGYLGRESKAKDFEIWQLAVGKDEDIKKIADFFGLRYEVDEKDETQFNHSLRTAVISPDGKIKKVYTGSDWKVEELLNQLRPKMDHSKMPKRK